MRILIATNHSYMFYRFRKELVEALMQEHEVILSTPFVGHEDDLQAMGLRCIETDIDRRSINPFKDMKLLKTYRQMLDELQPDLPIPSSPISIWAQPARPKASLTSPTCRGWARRLKSRCCRLWCR